MEAFLFVLFVLFCCFEICLSYPYLLVIPAITLLALFLNGELGDL